ncbi:MAG TPA: metalloprotease TldD [Burkholderiales bacterium]|nr:metalloprotease TldD [Burkholderiales bacterium]
MEVKENLKLASNLLLVPYGLDELDLSKAFGLMMTHQVDYADLYFQFSRSESWSLEEGTVKSGSFAIDQGVGVRAVSGERTAFAYSDDISFVALEQTVRATRAIARQGGESVRPIVAASGGHVLYPAMDPLADFDSESRIAILHRVEALARAKDPRVTQVIAGLAGEYEVILVARHDGHLAADVRPLVRLSVQIIVESNGHREQGYAGGGGRFGYEWFNETRIAGFVDDAVHQALVNLDAEPAPAGPMTVVLGAGWPGILLHEAIGHGLEGDFNRKGSSAFSNRIGEKVASSGVTVVDNGTLEGRRGSLNIDDEGNPTSCTTLIENGILRNYLQDSLNARLMRMPITGNARRESYAHIPMPRMTNTYMLNGDMAPEEIMASVKSGLYAVNFGGGQVDITSGKFVFSTAEAYLIENGQITRPVKGATLIGNGPDVLTRVSMIGNDMRLDSGIGTCGKEGQSVPVGVGQPTLRIDGLTVGGTA